MSSASVLHPALSCSSTRDKTTAGLQHHSPAAPCPSPRNFPREPAAKALPIARCLLAAHRTGTAHRMSMHNTRALQTARAPHAAMGTAHRHGQRSVPGHRTLPAPPYPSRRPKDGLRLLKEIQGIDGAAGPARSEGRSFHLPPPPAPLRSSAAPSRAEPSRARSPRRPRACPPAPRAPFAWARPQRRARAAGRTTRGVGGRRQVHAPGVLLTARRPPPTAGGRAHCALRALRATAMGTVLQTGAPRNDHKQRAVPVSTTLQPGTRRNGHEHHGTARDIMQRP